MLLGLVASRLGKKNSKKQLLCLLQLPLALPAAIKDATAATSADVNGKLLIGCGRGPIDLRVPTVVLDHVRQFDDEFALLVLLARLERVFLSTQSKLISFIFTEHKKRTRKTR